LKAHACKDGKVRVFASDENCDRMNAGADRLYMPHVPKELFTHAIDQAIRLNAAYIPPYGQGGSLYIR
jgi:branched-chain amino acid aminotransferase